MSTPPKRSRKSAAARQDENKENNQPMEVDAPNPPIEDDDMNEFDDEEGKHFSKLRNIAKDFMSFFFRSTGSYRVGDIYIPPPVKPYCSNESVGARLIITNILNRDFKSYAGDVELGPFTHVS